MHNFVINNNRTEKKPPREFKWKPDFFRKKKLVRWASGCFLFSSSSQSVWDFGGEGRKTTTAESNVIRWYSFSSEAAVLSVRCSFPPVRWKVTHFTFNNRSLVYSLHNRRCLQKRVFLMNRWMIIEGKWVLWNKKSSALITSNLLKPTEIVTQRLLHGPRWSFTFAGWNLLFISFKLYKVSMSYFRLRP